MSRTIRQEARTTAPRAVNPHKHAARRDEFIDAGQRLIQSHGYEQVSIEDLLNEVGASKGAFYHYFGSKQDLLEAIVDRLVTDALARVAAVVADEHASAVEKFRDYFQMIAALKAERRDFVLQLMKVWFSDDNAIVRDKLRREQIHRVTPDIAAIIRQGVGEGTFTLSDPDQMARVVLALILDTADEAGELFVARQAGEVDIETVRRRFETYQVAIQRLLGVAPGTLRLLDDDTLRMWFDEGIVTNQGKENS